MIEIRQEPCVYVNGKPYNVRSTDDMTNHLMMTEVFLLISIIVIVIIIITIMLDTGNNYNLSCMTIIVVILIRQATSRAWSRRW